MYRAIENLEKGILSKKGVGEIMKRFLEFRGSLR